MTQSVIGAEAPPTTHVALLRRAGQDLETPVSVRPHLTAWIAAVVTLLISAWIVFQLVSNKGFRWSVVGHYLFAHAVLTGVLTTLWLTVLVMVIGAVLGVVLAVMRMSSSPFASGFAGLYVWFFRGTPAMVQLIFWFNLATLFPIIKLGVPFGGPQLVGYNANTIITPLIAAMLGLGLNEGAYMSEIVRGGLLSVDQGQSEASCALGHLPRQTLFNVVLPQAMRSIIPATGNQTIGMLKYTSLASIVGLRELLLSVQTIYNTNYEIIALLIVASLWYLVLTTVLTMIQSRIERYYNRGNRATTPTGWDTVRASLAALRVRRREGVSHG